MYKRQDWSGTTGILIQLSGKLVHEKREHLIVLKDAMVTIRATGKGGTQEVKVLGHTLDRVETLPGKILIEAKKVALKAMKKSAAKKK